MRRFGDAVPAPACRPDAEPPRSRNASAASLAPWRPLRSTPVGVLLGAGPADAAAQCVRRPGSRESESVCPAAVCRIRPLQPETAPGMYARRITCKQTANDRHHGHTLKAISRKRAESRRMPAPKGSGRCDPIHRKRPLSRYAGSPMKKYCRYGFSTICCTVSRSESCKRS